MGVVFKFLKELNSAGSEKLISLAVVLGLISGFLPFFNVFTLLILFIAFVIRIPFGLFLSSWGVFSVTGYFLDPVFAKTGYFILTSSLLTPLWEFLYNVPLMRWSGFNNTVVMGGLVWGMVFGVLLFFVLSKSIGFYRKKFMDFCSKYSALKWIVPDFSQKTKFIRVSGVLGFFIIFGGFGLIIALLFDPVVKKVSEYTLSKVFHKPVKIGSLNTSLLKAKVDMNNIYIGEIKTDKINLKLSWYYLLWRKFDIEYLHIVNIHTEKGIKEIIGTPGEKTAQKSKSDILKKVNISLPKPEDIIKGYKLESLQKIEKLKKDYKKFETVASQAKKDLDDSKQKMEDIKLQIKELEKLSKNIKSADDIQKILAKADEIKENINSLKERIKNEKNGLLTLKKQIMNDLDEIKKASKSDYERLASKYDMLKNGEYYAFAQTFLQPEVKKHIDKAIKYYKIIQPYLKNNKPQKEEYIRAKGKYVTFKDKIKYPDFVLEKADVSGKSADADAKAEIADIASDQTLLNKEGVINVSAASKYFKSALVNVKYLNKIKIKLDVDDIAVKKLNAGELYILNPKIRVKSHGKIDAENFDIVTSINIKPEKITFSSNKYIAKVMQKLKKLNLKILISGNVQKYDVKIQSDIDRLFEKYLKEEMNSQIKKAKNRLKEVLNKKIQSEISKTGLNMNEFNIINDMDSYENGVNSLQKSLSNYTEKQLSRKLLKKGIGNFIKF